MISKLRGFSNSKLAGVLVGIIIIPFVFWGMGSVFSGGNTNNVAKINNEAISSKDFVNFINESRLTNDIIKANIDKNIIENILSELVSEKLIEMEIKELNVSMSEEALANKIRSNSILLDDNKNFSRVKYEKFLLENNLSASTFENSSKKQELKENLFNYISGGIRSPYFLKNKIYINYLTSIFIVHTPCQKPNIIKTNHLNICASLHICIADARPYTYVTMKTSPPTVFSSVRVILLFFF